MQMNKQNEKSQPEPSWDASAHLPFIMQAGQTMLDASAKVMEDPQYMHQATNELWAHTMEMWSKSMEKFGATPEQSANYPGLGDRRFRDPAWDGDPTFQLFKQNYLMYSNWVDQQLARLSTVCDDHEVRKIRFYTKQLVDALSPSNFPWSNPVVLSKTMETQGQNLMQGFQNYLEDIKNGQLRITDTKAFELGKNLATTPGKVIFQNELMQLIQYSPSTTDVFSIPILIVPPWINKFYIFDLQEKNSFIKWMVDQGHTVFLISWVNPDTSLKDFGLEEYFKKGIEESLKAVREITQSTKVNAIGHCLGGALLTIGLGSLPKEGREIFNSLTLLTAPIDFSKIGDLLFFTDKDFIERVKDKINELGYLDGRLMANTFNLMRANDLIWSSFVNNYLLGQEPAAFDMLYWNSDSTNLPAKMFFTYIDMMFKKNVLMHPGKYNFMNSPIDITKVTTPSFILATKEDHIVPWTSAYEAAKMFDGACKFVLAGSGHIAGIINPPTHEKYGYHTLDEIYDSSQKWLEEANPHTGSWWQEWKNWVKPLSGEKVSGESRMPGLSTAYPALDDAPGSYVKRPI
jgi:polyhydroxyalkanoate synthase